MGDKTTRSKRVTIHDIAREIGIAPSSVSKALNDLPSISSKIKTLVKAKATELNYKHNLSAANLRRGSSRTIGVVVPKINVAFFSDAIGGMEENCFENNHRLIICQSDESYEKEVQAVETLIRQNVDCIIISLSHETVATGHLKEIAEHHINLIQFDRVNDQFKSHIIVNDNKAVSYKAVKHLTAQGYKKIAFLGGPDHLSAYRERREGYMQAMEEADLTIPYHYVVPDVGNMPKAMAAAEKLLQRKDRPDAFFAVSDHAALGVLKVAAAMGINIPEDMGIMGFANEMFTDVTSPRLSSVDQQSKQIGREASNIYFNHIIKARAANKPVGLIRKVIESKVVVRESSSRRIR